MPWRPNPPSTFNISGRICLCTFYGRMDGPTDGRTDEPTDDTTKMFKFLNLEKRAITKATARILRFGDHLYQTTAITKTTTTTTKTTTTITATTTVITHRHSPFTHRYKTRKCALYFYSSFGLRNRFLPEAPKR